MRWLQLFVGFLSLQYLVYSCLGVVAVYFYFAQPDVDSTGGTFESAVYLRFIKNDVYDYDDLSVPPYVFVALMFIYIFVDGIFAYECMKTLKYLIQKSDNTFPSLICFSIYSLVLNLRDLVFTIMIGVDYGKECSNPANYVENNICQNGVLPVMFIIAKGFLVLVFNLVVGLFFFIVLRQIFHKSKNTIAAVATVEVTVTTIEVEATVWSS